MGRKYDFSEGTRRTAAGRVGYRCSICDVPTIGPHSDKPTDNSQGEGAHILSHRGPRAQPDLSLTQLKALENCIWLCLSCHRLVDVEESAWTISELEDRRRHAEELARWRLTGRVPPTGWEIIGRIHAALQNNDLQIRMFPTRATAWVWESVRHVDVPLDDRGLDAVLDDLDRHGLRVQMAVRKRTLNRRGRTANVQVSREVKLQPGVLFLPTGSLHGFAAGGLYVHGEIVYAEENRGIDAEWSYRPV